ncbi:Protein prenyltransferase [Sarocladium implicatum]|nr:Protein prenyltransferase [Sarocladium implicatum]
MSRALDPATKAAIQNGDHTEAFREISKVLAQCLETLLEIELVGPEFMMMLPSPDCYFLLDGKNLILPKLRLVQAFIVARTLLFKHRKDRTSVPKEDVAAATMVMLLMDAEHLTAANTRKRLIVEGGYNPDTIRQELSFVDTLLTSPLHRHTKSPNLWSHRHWLIAQQNNRYDQKGKLVRQRKHDYVPHDDLLSYHFKSVIFVSGEQHPRNYYAWAHARQLLPMADDTCRGTLLTAMRDWCLEHRGDISGWTFLAALPAAQEKHKDLLAEVLRVAKMFNYSNESVWWYFKAGASSPEELAELRKMREKLLPEADELDRVHLERAAEWLGETGNPIL